ncbi:MAG: low molecular weight phosphatase family protein [Patescibacteria group bacterium]
MKILFICKNNQFRSQMAASIYNKMTGTNDAYSAGTYVGSVDVPEGTIIEGYFRTSDFFEVMEKNGINIRNNRTKKLLPEMVKNAKVVVSMAEEPFVPDFLRDSGKVMLWKVENPSFATRDISERTYVQIKSLIEQLILRNVNSSGGGDCLEK